MKNKRMLLIAIVIALVVGAFIGGYVLLGGKNTHTDPPDGGTDLATPEATVEPETSPEPTKDIDGTDQENTPEPQDNQQGNNETQPGGNTNTGRLKDVKVKAIYYSASSASVKNRIDWLIKMAKNTELNAVVIDIKERDGIVAYESNIPEVRKHNLYKSLYKPEELIKRLHENGIYVIGRIVCFNDDGLGKKRPDLAIKKNDGTPWVEGGITWVNAYNDEVQKYNMDIAKEAIEKGFDEIQFDYVRFPSGTEGKVDYGNVPSKADAIGKFLQTAHTELLGKRDVPVSADVFGYICISKTTKDTIGQDLESLVQAIDYLSPMVYPSHYANAAPKGVMANGVGQNVNGVLYTKPDLDPYGVVYNTLIQSNKRIASVEAQKATFRPYLQAFTASYLPEGYWINYGAKEIRQQIKAVYDAGYEEWILWASNNVYPEAAFLGNP